MKLILASASHERSKLLKRLGLVFETIVSSVDEKSIHVRDFSERPKILALEKARNVAKNLSEGVVIGADTIGIFDGQLLEKPIDASDARNTLRKLSGNTHTMISGIAIVDAKTGKQVVDSVKTQVTFRKLSDKEIDDYVRSGEPLTKAGSYAIMGGAAGFVSRIDGCFYNIAGLPVSKLVELLQNF